MINEQNYNYFITSLKQQFHIDISLYKQDRMRRRIDSLSRKGFENYTHFINALRNDQELFTHFIDPHYN